MMWLCRTSVAVTRRLSQSTRGRTLRINSGWKSSSVCSSSASWKCSGKEAGEVLQSLTAQVTKLAVMTFMVVVGCGIDLAVVVWW